MRLQGGYLSCVSIQWNIALTLLLYKKKCFQLAILFATAMAAQMEMENNSVKLRRKCHLPHRVIRQVSAEKDVQISRKGRCVACGHSWPGRPCKKGFVKRRGRCVRRFNLFLLHQGRFGWVYKEVQHDVCMNNINIDVKVNSCCIVSCFVSTLNCIIIESKSW